MIRWAAAQYLYLLLVLPVVVAVIATGGWPIRSWCRA